MTYDQVVEYLYQQLPVFQLQGARAYKPGLHTTRQFCERLGNPQNTFRSIHIAGTNGKGSTSHMLAAVLQKAGYRTGLYTSPHLKSFTERIRVNGTPADPDFIVDFVATHKDFIEQVHPSFFEVTVAMAFTYFAQQNVDVAVVEVGMGGRLDSTNVLIPELSLITNISYDHMQYLGSTLPEIAYEKAGIIKPGVPVIISEKQEESVSEVFRNKAAETGSDLVFASDELEVVDKFYQDGKLVIQVDEKKSGQILYDNLELDLSGSYQLKNILGVLTAVQLLNQKGFSISEEALRNGLSETTTLTGLKGRWQKLGEKPLILCDTAHNVAGLKSVVAQLGSMPVNKLRLVLGFVADKDVRSILELLPKDAVYYFCAPSISRALDATQLLEMADSVGLHGKAFLDVNMALAEAVKDAAPDDIIFAGGSTFVVADINQV